MAKNAFREASGKVLNSTEKQAISKLMKAHQPMLKELEKWKESREKLETTLFDQIERIGKFLEPYQDPTRIQATLAGLAGQKQPKARYTSKKASSVKSSSKPKSRSTRKSK